MGRDRLDPDPLRLERREDGRNRAGAAGDAATQLATLGRGLEHVFQGRDDPLRVRRPPVAELDLDRLAAEAALQLLRCPLDDHPPEADDREPVGKLVGLLHVVRRQEDRQRLALGEPFELLPHRCARLGIEAGRRLVQEEHLRTMDEPEGDVEPPLHAARVASHDAVGRVGEPEQIQQLADPRLESADARALRHVADCPPDGICLGDDVVAGHLGPARIRRRQRREHLDRRRLAGSIRAEQPEELAGVDAEADSVERPNRAVALAQPLDDDRVHAHRV